MTTRAEQEPNMIIPWSMAYQLAKEHQRELIDAARRRQLARERRLARRTPRPARISTPE